MIGEMKTRPLCGDCRQWVSDKRRIPNPYGVWVETGKCMCDEHLGEENERCDWCPKSSVIERVVKARAHDEFLPPDGWTSDEQLCDMMAVKSIGWGRKLCRINGGTKVGQHWIIRTEKAVEIVEKRNANVKIRNAENGSHTRRKDQRRESDDHTDKGRSPFSNIN